MGWPWCPAARSISRQRVNSLYLRRRITQLRQEETEDSVKQILRPVGGIIYSPGNNSLPLPWRVRHLAYTQKQEEKTVGKEGMLNSGTNYQKKVLESQFQRVSLISRRYNCGCKWSRGTDQMIPQNPFSPSIFSWWWIFIQGYSKIRSSLESPGGPVVRTLRFYGRENRFSPWSGNK